MIDLFALYDIIKNDLTCIEWLINKGILKRDVRCVSCAAPMVLAKKGRNINGYVWRCRNRSSIEAHDTERGICTDSLFEDAKIPLRRLLTLIYEFSYETPVERASKKVGISLHSAIRWYKKLRRLMSDKVNRSDFFLVAECQLFKLTSQNF